MFFRSYFVFLDVGRSVFIIKILWYGWWLVRWWNFLVDIRICDKEYEKGVNFFRKEYKNIIFLMDCMLIIYVKY